MRLAISYIAATLIMMFMIVNSHPVRVEQVIKEVEIAEGIKEEIDEEEMSNDFIIVKMMGFTVKRIHAGSRYEVVYQGTNLVEDVKKLREFYTSQSGKEAEVLVLSSRNEEEVIAIADINGVTFY